MSLENRFGPLGPTSVRIPPPPLFLAGLGEIGRPDPGQPPRHAGAGVAEREAGLASGLINTSQQIGGAIGVAVASTVFTSRFDSLVEERTALPEALTGGYRWAFWALAVFGAAATVAAATLIRREELAESPTAPAA